MATKRINSIKESAKVGRNPSVEDLPFVTDAVFAGAPYNVLALSLSDGTRRFFPREDLQVLNSADDTMASKIEILGHGRYLHWPALDFDLYLPELLAGVTGTKQWMQELGRRGGQAKTPRKSQASRENGRKGGRPRSSYTPLIRKERV